MDADSQRLEQQQRRLTSLVFGGTDMTDVLVTARYLRGDRDGQGDDADLPWQARRTLEVGMFVVYARPFTETRGLARLRPASGLSDELKETHKEILERRDRFYAHTDDTPHRRILELDAGEWASLLDPSARITEQWSAPMPKLLGDVIELAAANRTSFFEEIERLAPRIQAQLAATART